MPGLATTIAASGAHDPRCEVHPRNVTLLYIMQAWSSWRGPASSCRRCPLPMREGRSGPP